MNITTDAAQHAIALGAWLKANDPERRRPCPWCGAPDASHNHETCSFRGRFVPCDHSDETTTRVAHGYLGDAPAGTVETLCCGCGTVLDSRPPEAIR